MASSNVEYYENQKQLQDVMTTCEQERMDLDRQLRIALQADQTSSKMKAARLHSYWKKICEDEKRAKQRREMLTRKFERIDAHMSEMNSRTMRLAHMKKQYEDYIARTYPEWNELMYGKPQAQPMAENTPQHMTENTHHVHHQQTFSPQESVGHQQPQNQTEPKHVSSVPSMISSTHSNSLEQKLHEDSVQSMRNAHSHYSPRESEGIKADNDHFLSQESGIYQNLPSARSDSQKRNAIFDDDSPQRNPPRVDESSSYQSEAAGMSQPVQSIDIQSRTSGQRIQSSNKSMQPVLDEEDEDEEETSEFGTDSEIPMGQSLQNTQIRADIIQNHQSNHHGVIKPELTIEGLLHLLNLVEKDVADAFSMEGYYRSSTPDNSLKNDIVRKANSHGDLSRIDANLISMVILEQITLIVRSLAENCLIPESLLQEDIRALTQTKLKLHLSPEGQVVWGALFAHFEKLVKAQVMDPSVLSAVFTPCLVAEGGSQDKAYMFIVHLLEANEAESPRKLMQTNKSVSPAATMEGSGSFMEDGKVPRLKFGSLLDKPYSDDESSLINSLPRDPVPLNETAAYKSMLSTGSRDKPKQQSSLQEDTDDDVENQIATALTRAPVTHQSPRKKIEMDEPSEASSQTLQTTSHVYVPTALEPKSPRRPNMGMQPQIQRGVKISSDLDTDTEVDANIFGSSRKVEDDFDFYD